MGNPGRTQQISPQLWQVPSDCIGYITGSRRVTLGRMEEELLGRSLGRVLEDVTH